MAIVINSLTPTNPSTSAGNSVTFIVDAVDTNGGTLTYQWQFSQDGNQYTSSGLVNNTSSTYTTSNLSVNQNGLYFRVAISDGVTTIYSNEYPGIGNRIVTVVQDPAILVLVDQNVDFYPETNPYVVTVGQSVSFVVTSSLANADITNTNLISGINILWQYSDDSGNNWNDMSTGGNINITTSTSGFGTTPETYYKYSTLQISNISFTQNLYLYRARVSYSGAINNPVTLNNITLLVDPQINIYRNPGEGDDTLEFSCYKTTNSNSGKVKLQVGALSTANTTLFYEWQFSTDNINWSRIETLTINSIARLKPGTTATTDVLELERVIFYDPFYVKCVISGSSGESSVDSNSHRIYATDVQVAPIIPSNTYNVIEDKYGNIPDRDIYVNDTIQSLILESFLDVYRNTGLNGDIQINFQRKNPGASTWDDISQIVDYDKPNNFSLYTNSPSSTSNDFIGVEYETPPLRVSVDNGAKYRLKISSTALFTLNGNNKTLLPYYSDEILLNVYRTIYIINQPSDVSVIPNNTASFGVTANVSSGNNSEISYQWQYNTRNSNVGWQNIPNSSPYSGVNTSALQISNISATPTHRFFRCVLSVSNQLASVTSNVATLTIIRDLFTFIPGLNDYYLNEFDVLQWVVNPTSLSNKAITYQWQKSTNYNVVTQIGNWNNISGATTNSFQILSVGENDSGFYRVKYTSFGGEIAYSNAAKVVVTDVNIIITENIPSSITVREGVNNPYLFSCLGVSTLGERVTYQWEIKRDGDSDFSNIGSGFNESSDTTRQYAPLAFDKIDDDGAIIRCKISSASTPFDVYTNQCTVNVDRIFTYFADIQNKNVTAGDTLILNLSPSFTGGSPSYMWQENGVDLNETGSSLVIPSIDSFYNGKTYRCRINLEECNKHRYSRNNVLSTVDVTPPSAFTLAVTINVISAPSKALYYSTETSKTGAAIGTVICVAKPPDYVEDLSASDDDTSRWKISRSGTVSPDTITISSIRNSSNPSTGVDGNVWSINKPSWVDNRYTSPKWILENDRFKGYIEMRGQWLYAIEFPELARMFGNTFGGNVPDDTYPNYLPTHTFRMPNLYGKRLLGTGNINNNRGAVSITPEYAPDGLSGGDKNVPGSIGGRYNYTRTSQLPPGSPGISGEADGTAGQGIDPIIYSLGTFRTSGVSEAGNFVQPTMRGTVTYRTLAPAAEFTDTPLHSHVAVSVGFRNTPPVMTSGECRGTTGPIGGNNEPLFFATRPGAGVIRNGPAGAGQPHPHGVQDQGPGSFDMIADAGMSISDTNIVLSGQSSSIFNNNLAFYLRNNSDIPLNSPYFRLKYLIKAY